MIKALGEFAREAACPWQEEKGWWSVNTSLGEWASVSVSGVWEVDRQGRWSWGELRFGLDRQNLAPWHHQGPINICERKGRKEIGRKVVTPSSPHVDSGQFVPY